MTAYADQRERAANLDALIHDVILKPFTLAEIKSAVGGCAGGDEEAVGDLGRTASAMRIDAPSPRLRGEGCTGPSRCFVWERGDSSPRSRTWRVPLSRPRLLIL